jgi:hypothetical protein
VIQNFTPPSADFATVRTFQDLRDRALEWITRYTNYVSIYFQTDLLPSLNADFYNFGPDIASATVINPTNYIQRVSGSAAIETINAPAGFSGTIVLLSENGFTIGTGGNVTPAVTVPAGHGVSLTYHAALQQWVAITS